MKVDEIDINECLRITADNKRVIIIFKEYLTTND